MMIRTNSRTCWRIDAGSKDSGIKTELEIVNEIGYKLRSHGEVSEWSMVPDSKSGVRQRT